MSQEATLKTHGLSFLQKIHKMFQTLLESDRLMNVSRRFVVCQSDS